MEALLGVTRVARVTGLDRSGVEVACAVRPRGHVLQVSNGKGLTWEEARASALSEVRGALLEAAQSRLTDVHGAREDVAAADPSMIREVRAACSRARPRTLREMPSSRRVHLPSRRVSELLSRAFAAPCSRDGRASWA